MGVRGTIARTPVGRLIWPRGRKEQKPPIRRNRLAAWLADSVRAARGRGAREERRLRPTRLDAPLANALGEKLWGGFARYALDDLEAIRRSDSLSLTERRAAAWYLAEWKNFQGDFPSAFPYLEFANGLGGEWRLEKPNLFFETNVLLKLGRISEAEAVVSEATEKHGYDADICLLFSNVLRAKAEAGDRAAADEARLSFLNRIYADSGLYPLRIIDTNRPLSIDNVSAPVPSNRTISDGPLISVIMPAHNAADTIRFALRGLQEQSWRNLEVVVVDDASTDNTGAVVLSIAAEDPRIRLVRLDQGLGAYVARNKGADEARGELVTVHDSDDWSHSQKLEVQARRIIESDAVATLTYWVRVAPDLHVKEHWRPDDRIVHTNHSSMMVQADVFRSLGGWDPVRVTGDTELIRRIARKYRKARVPRLVKGIPLSFGLEREQALTQAGATHLRTLFFGVRHEYRRAMDRWHLAAERSGDFYLNPDPRSPRRFPAPYSILPISPDESKYDAIFVADLALPRSNLATVEREIARALESGDRIGVFHWPCYELDILREIDESIARMIDQFRIRMITADEIVACRQLVFFTPWNLAHRIDRVPKVAFDEMHVIEEAAGAQCTGAAKENLLSMFGSPGNWIRAMPAPSS